MTPAARPARLGDGEVQGRPGRGWRGGPVDAGAPGPAPRADRTRPAAPTSSPRCWPRTSTGSTGPCPALRAAAPDPGPLGRGPRAAGCSPASRLLAAGNGGSAAEAQHLTAELVGRFDGDRRPLSAIALHADTSSLSAIGNDYGFAQVYARQVRAHARPGDVLLMFSTSGRSENLVEAAAAAAALGVTSWAVTGPGPNPLAAACTDAVCLPGDTATVQEMHLAALHMLCRAVERVVADAPPEPGERVPVDRPRVVS